MHNNFKKTLLALSLIAGTSLLSACGGSGGSSTPTAPVNTAPVVTGDASPTVAENHTEVGTYTATDAEGDAITFSLSGADAGLFTIDNSGSLSFVTAPDYDNGEVGPFAVTVVATDNGAGSLSGQFAAQVSVSNEVDPSTRAVVQTVDPGYTSSKVVVIDGQTSQITAEVLFKGTSDYAIDTYQSDIYHIGRGGLNTIDKHNVDTLVNTPADTPAVPTWSHTTIDAGANTYSNTYSIVFASETKAYVIRYGTEKIWIVNPQAQEPENFKIGELDLGAYTLADNATRTPRSSAGTVVDGKLYIAMQRLDDNWQPSTAYIAVFDTETDEEIETNAFADDELKGIPLAGQNPLENSVYSFNNKVYVTSRSRYDMEDIEHSLIEEINPADYTVRPVLIANSIDGNESHGIRGSVILSEEKGYFFTNAYDANYNETSTLYEFNPTSGEIIETDVGGNGTEAINFITLDKSNILWVSAISAGTPGIDLIDTATNTKVGTRILTELNPNAIRFVD